MKQLLLVQLWCLHAVASSHGRRFDNVASSVQSLEARSLQTTSTTTAPNLKQQAEQFPVECPPDNTRYYSQQQMQQLQRREQEEHHFTNPLMLHDRRSLENSEFLQQYRGFHIGWNKKFFQTELSEGTLPSYDELVQTIGGDRNDGNAINQSTNNGDETTYNFIYWGYDHGTFQVSAFEASHSSPMHPTSWLEHSYDVNSASSSIKVEYLNPLNVEKTGQHGTLDDIMTEKNIQILDHGDENINYVAFVSLFFDEYQHLLIDHLGYLAYLRKHEPSTTRFILVDVAVPNGETQTVQQKLFQTLDPDFYRRIDWLHIDSNRSDTIGGWTPMAQIKGGSSGKKLKVVTPLASTRHLELLQMAREWILESPLFTITAAGNALPQASFSHASQTALPTNNNMMVSEADSNDLKQENHETEQKGQMSQVPPQTQQVQPGPITYAQFVQQEELKLMQEAEDSHNNAAAVASRIFAAAQAQQRQQQQLPSPQELDRNIELSAYHHHVRKLTSLRGGRRSLQQEDAIMIQPPDTESLPTQKEEGQVATELFRPSACGPNEKPRNVIYYSRHSPTAGHGRNMDALQESEILGLIEHFIQRFNRCERLVVFDGTLSIPEQIILFRDASVVIGPHGGGIANIIFLPGIVATRQGNEGCIRNARPKLLEFVTSPDTPSVQNDGSFFSNYYNFFTTCPWVEYHQLLFVEPSNQDTTFINMDSFKDALLDIFGNIPDEHVLIPVAQ